LRPKEPNKTKKLKTVPLPITEDEKPHHASPTAQPPPPGGSQDRVSSGYGPPSSGNWQVEAQVATERSTEPTLTVPDKDKTETAMLTVITGFNAGQVFMLDGTDLVIGRGNDTGIPIEDAGVSRAHARISKEGLDWYVEDLSSTNGTFVAAIPVRGKTLLARGDRIQLGPSLMLRFDITYRQEAEMQHRLYESSTRDALTRAYNRKYLMERLTAEVAHSRRHKVKMSVLILDLDRFKVLNDTYGHLAGDAVLRAVSHAVQKLIRVEDLLARYGGEEFVILARSTGRTDATRLAERIRKTLEALETPVGEDILKVTVSIGLAPLSDVGDNGGPNEVLALADERLYRAKNSGRNRVISADA
jgi:diguanylate cyclase (GGDEF)-like protein